MDVVIVIMLLGSNEVHQLLNIVEQAKVRSYLVTDVIMWSVKIREEFKTKPSSREVGF